MEVEEGRRSERQLRDERRRGEEGGRERGRDQTVCFYVFCKAER